MAIIQPVKGLRYSEAAGELSALCCPPYDIVSPEQRKALLEKSEYNLIRLELPQGENAYESAAQTLSQWRKDGILLQDEPSVYIYEMEFSLQDFKGVVRGLVCGVKLEEFEKGVILPHENTLSKAKEDRLLLLKACACNFSEIYCLYSDENGETEKLIFEASKEKPEAEFTDDSGVTHRLWRSSNGEYISKLAEKFMDKKLYIADGHHRYETALKYRDFRRASGSATEKDPCDYQLMMLTSMQCPGLLVLPTHRIVRKAAITPDELLTALKGEFETLECSDMRSAAEKMRSCEEAAFTMLCGEKTYLLKLKNGEMMNKMMPQCSDALRSLDVSILHSMILAEHFGIDALNMQKQSSLEYTRSEEEAEAAVRSGECDFAFLLKATRVSQISAVALAGEKMPQKSTYFYPKLISGLVMNPIE